MVSGVTLSQVQDLAFILVQLHVMDDCPVLQPIQIPLQSLISRERVNSISWFGIISKLAQGAVKFCLQMTDQRMEQNWP